MHICMYVAMVRIGTCLRKLIGKSAASIYTSPAVKQA